MSVTAIESLEMDTTGDLPWWPVDRLAVALGLLARRLGAKPQGDLCHLPADGRETAHWLGWTSSRLGLDMTQVEAHRSDMALMLRNVGPAVLWNAGERRFLVLLGSGPFGVKLLAQSGTVERHRVAEVAKAHLPEAHPSTLRQISRVAAAARLPERASHRLKEAILSKVEEGEPVTGIWALRLAGSGAMGRAIREGGLIGLALAIFCLAMLGQAAEVFGWAIAGSGRLTLGQGWAAAWVLCLLTPAPLGLLSAQASASFARKIGIWLRQRLNDGALALDADILRSDGAAGHLARGLEAQAFEGAALQLALGAMGLGSSLIWTIWVLWQGAASLPLLTLFGLWLGLQTLFGLRYARKLEAWTEVRRGLTARLVERMVGHRTVLAQERPEVRDARQDADLARYAKASGVMDRASLPFLSGLPLGWMVLGMLALMPAYVAGAAPGQVAIALGGLFLAGRSLGGVAALLLAWSTARIAWKQIEPLMAAGRVRPETSDFVPLSSLYRQGPMILSLQDATLDHPGRAPVLDNASLAISKGDRLLLEGPSGTGKSTLTRALSGHGALRSGRMILADGRPAPHPLHHRIVASAPQFQDNHILTGSLAFNLLMARQWPPSKTDMEEARALCRELGLSPLLDRMPGGLMTQLGETGWQLSHGEKSRIFLARALLQRAQLVMLDESFAALDPETLALCLQTARTRAEALLVVAHP